VSAAGRFAASRGFVADLFADVRASPRLARRIFLRGLRQEYRHSILGIVLAFAPVALTALVIAFGRRAQIFSEEIGGVHAAFFGAFGILLAQAFSEAYASTQRLFTANAALLKRQNVAIEAPIVASLVDAAFRDLVRLAVIGILMAVFHVSPSPWFPLAAWGLLGVSLAGAALGLAAAPFAALTADLQLVARGLMVVVITVTPVFVILPPDSAFGRVQQAIPLSWAFDGIRAAAYGGSGSLWAAALAMPCSLAFVAFGAFLCRLARPHVIERMTGGGA
jgi:lipopolysaccharide transport system permease protein